MSESVARRLRHPIDSEHSSLRRQVGSERIHRASVILKFELSSWILVPVRVSVAPTPSAFGKTGQEKRCSGISVS